MPKAEIRPAGRALARFDGVVMWKTTEGPLRYLVEERKHFRHQDVGVVTDQLIRRRGELPRLHADDRLLLLAPHVRPQQAAVLERAEIDYLDLYWRGMHWPAFNLADVLVVGSAGLLVLASFKPGMPREPRGQEEAS